MQIKHFTAWKSIEIVLKYTKMTKSKKTSKRVNLNLEWNNNTSPQASRSLLCIRFAAVAFWSEKEILWRRGSPWPILASPPGGSGRKTTTLARDHEYFIPTKFHQNPSSGSGEEVENVKSLMDRRMDDAWLQQVTEAFGSCALKSKNITI